VHPAILLYVILQALAVVALPVLSNLIPAAHPHTVPQFLYMCEKFLQSCCAAGATGEAAVKADAHHAAVAAVALLEQEVEAVLEHGEELVPVAEAIGSGKPHVVLRQGVRHDEVRPAVLEVPVGQIVSVRVAVVKEAPLFHCEAPGVLVGLSLVEPTRPLP